MSKNERGYALRDGFLGRATKAEPVRLALHDSEASAFRTTAMSCLRHYRFNEIALLGGPDPEALHQARVALRRLRSALALFRPTVKGSDYEHVRSELRWFAGRFGEARNLDVLLAGKILPADPALRHAIEQERGLAYEQVQAALRSERGRQLMLRLALWIELGGWARKGRASVPVQGLAARQLERQWRKVCRRGAELGSLDADSEHQLRLDIKKLRYTAEFLTSLFPEKALASRSRRFVSALKDLQERLGVANDARVARELVARLSPGLVDRIAIPDVPVADAEKAYRKAAASSGYWLAPA